MCLLYLRYQIMKHPLLPHYDTLSWNERVIKETRGRNSVPKSHSLQGASADQHWTDKKVYGTAGYGGNGVADVVADHLRRRQRFAKFSGNLKFGHIAIRNIRFASLGIGCPGSDTDTCFVRNPVVCFNGKYVNVETVKVNAAQPRASRLFTILAVFLQNPVHQIAIKS